MIIRDFSFKKDWFIHGLFSLSTTVDLDIPVGFKQW